MVEWRAVSREFLLSPIAVGCWLTAGVLVGVPEVAGAAGAVLAAMALGLLVHAVIRRRAGALALVAVLLAAAALVAVVAAVRAPQRQPEELVALGAGRSVAAVAVLTSSPVVRDGPGGGIRFRVELREVGIGGESLVVAVPALVFAERVMVDGFNRADTEWAPSAALEDLGIGTVVEISGTMRATSSGDGSAFLFYARGPVTIREDASGPVAWASALRRGLVQASLALPGAGGRLLPGLAIGDVSAVDADLDAAMKTSALSHLTAVSGANCVLVVAAALILGSALGLTRRWRVLLALVFLAAFVVLVTPEGSVIRAAVMATIVLLALVSGRPSRGIPALCLAVIVLLVIDPWISRNYGFALSVLATAGLLVLSKPLSDALARWMPRTLAMVIALPLAAQLACQPVLVLLSPVVALYGVPANLLAAPAAPLATVIGMLVCFALPVLPWLAHAVLWVAWLPAAWIAAVAATFSGLPASSVPWLGGALGLGTAIVLTSLILLSLLGQRMRWGRWIQPASAFSLAVLLVCALTTIGVAALTRTISRPSHWQIAVCDVGQGDAIVLQSTDGVMLIDTGPTPEALRACLATLGISRIAVLVLTHFDFDHVGGTDAVIGRVDTVLHGPPGSPADEALSARLREAGATITPARAGDHGVLGEMSWEVLWPPRLPAGRSEVTGNSASIVVQTELDGLRSIFLGDLGEEAQLRLLPKLRAVDVVKVAHHGSGDQSSMLYERLAARLALISVGEDNSYGHPAASILATLASTATAIARTDREGMLLVVPGPSDGELKLWSERAADAGPRSAQASGALGLNTDTREARGYSHQRIRRNEEGRDCAACVEPGAAGAGRFGVGNRAVSGRARDPPTPRFSDLGRPEPRGQRRRSRFIRPW